MNKYYGIHTVEAKVTAGERALPEKKKKTAVNSYFKSLLLRSLIAVMIGAALFCAKLLPGNIGSVADKAKEIVAFDFIELISGEAKNGD